MLCCHGLEKIPAERCVWLREAHFKQESRGAIVGNIRFFWLDDRVRINDGIRKPNVRLNLG
jgi:hypothetical protein